MPTTSKDLGDDAQWKIIQKNTFTRWANQHLKQAGKQIADLQQDLSDGLRLLALVEVLAGHKFRHVNKRPNFRTQKLENVTLAIKFLEDEEGIRLVNIDSSDIVDSKLKLILGLIWTLILHYSISMPMWEGEEELPQMQPVIQQLIADAPISELTDGKGPSPRQRLLGWINSKMADKPINNFTTDWNDGTAIGALVDACAPGLCPDWDLWDTARNQQNCKEAMEAAEQWMEVAQLIRPEEMIDPNVDDKAMMTYLSQFPNAKLKDGAPLRPKTNPARVRAYGPGIDVTRPGLDPEGNAVGAPARFTVETFSAGRGAVDVAVLNPRGQQEACELIFNKDRNLTYSCTYTPTMEGEYKVSVKFAGHEIPKSPFKVVVEGAAGDPSRVTAAGNGIESSGNFVNKLTSFTIFAADAFINVKKPRRTTGAGPGNVDCVILDPHGKRDSVIPQIQLAQQQQETYLVEYKPRDEGLHSVNVFFAGQQIPGSPFGVDVASDYFPDRVRVTGRGVQPIGVRIGDNAEFKVHTDGAGDAECSVAVVGADSKELPCTQQPCSTDPSTIVCNYTATQAGQHTVRVKFGPKHAPGSPFSVQISKKSTSSVRAFGPGLSSAWCSVPALFTVESNGEEQALNFSIEGPSDAKLECSDNGDGSVDVQYLPTAAGEYAIHIMCNNEDILNSPFMSLVGEVQQELHPENVRVSGKGVGNEPLTIGESIEFSIDASEAGGKSAELLLLPAVYGPDGEPLEVVVRQVKQAVFSCSYVPLLPGKQTIHISYGGISVANSPFRTTALEPIKPENVRCSGAGLTSAIRRQPTQFDVDCSDAGRGDLAVSIRPVGTKSDIAIDMSELSEQPMQSKITRVCYTPQLAVDHVVTVTFADEMVNGSPFTVSVEPDIDVSGVRVLGVESDVHTKSFAKFTIDISSLGARADVSELSAVATCADQRIVGRLKQQQQQQSQYLCTYKPQQPGQYELYVEYSGLPIGDSPYTVNVLPGCDAKRVTASGPGLHLGITEQVSQFTVDTHAAGAADLVVNVDGPGDAAVKWHDNKDGTFAVQFVPSEAGHHTVSVLYGGQHISDSPFPIEVTACTAPHRCIASGPGLETGRVRASVPACFTVDTSRAGPGELAATYSQRGAAHPCEVTADDKESGRQLVTYSPEREGPTKVMVTFAGQPVPKSPFSLHVLPRCEPHKVVVAGDGVRSSGLLASMPTEFSIDTSHAGVGELQVTVCDSERRQLPTRVQQVADGMFACHFVPVDVGRYTVAVRFGTKEVPESPYHVRTEATGRADRVKIITPPQAIIPVNTETAIVADAREAGVGRVTCRVRQPDGVQLPVSCEENEDGTVGLFYSPSVAGQHSVELKFGGHAVPAGDFVQTVADDLDSVLQQMVQDVEASVEQHQQQPIKYNPVEFKLPADASAEAEVLTPSGITEKPTLKVNNHDTVTVRYAPSERGEHKLSLTVDSQHVAGSPLTFFVEAAGSGRVIAYGSGLSHGVTGETNEFTIVTKDAGTGGLALAIEGPSRAEINCNDNKDGTCSVTYLPLAPGDYTVVVKFGDKHIAGSPFTARVTGEPRKMAEVSVGQANEVPLRILDTDIQGLSTSIKGPNEEEQPCVLKRLANGHLGVAFIPRETGAHWVSVKRAGQPIPNSPFRIDVSADDVAEAGRVRVSGAGLQQATVGQQNRFAVDTRSAGYGALSLSVEGPSKADIECQDRHDGSCDVAYTPTLAGQYAVSVRYAGKHVAGSPFSVRAVGGDRSELNGAAEQPSATHVGSQCELSLRISGTEADDMEAIVAAPSGAEEAAEVAELQRGQYAVRFVPREPGPHQVSVLHKGSHVPGSPFQFTVGPLAGAGAKGVRVTGDGIERALAGKSNEFGIYTREAGAGGLGIAVEGPAKAEIGFQDRRDGWCAVTWTVPDPGEYAISIKFDGQHVTGSPFRVTVGGDPSLGKLQKSPADSVGQLAALTLRGASAGTMATVTPPNGAPFTAVVEAIEGTDQLTVRFAPTEPGAYTVAVPGGDGSPYRLLVPGTSGADPGAVRAEGEGLHRARVGQRAQFMVHTANAGSGALAVTVDGPSKVQLNCVERDNGYEFSFVPAVPGDYAVVIMYGGNFHIVGSPFTAHVTGEAEISTKAAPSQSALLVEAKSKQASFPDRIKCSGAALKSAKANQEASFIVDASRAGYDMLLAGILGPANSSDSVRVQHEGSGRYSVVYRVTTAGVHLLAVKWGDSHVPGSPFRVNVTCD